jgi:hypothetical protein
MNTRTHSFSVILITLIILITFPIWIGIAGGLFGIVVGVFGAVFGAFIGVFGALFGMIAGLIGALFGIIAWPFHAIFGHGSSVFFDFNAYIFFAIVILVFLLTQRGKKRV